MTMVGVHEAETQLPRLLDRIARGERGTITRHGVPVAMLVPAAGARACPIAEVIDELRAFARGRRLGMSLRRAIAARGD